MYKLPTAKLLDARRGKPVIADIDDTTNLLIQPATGTVGEDEIAVDSATVMIDGGVADRIVYVPQSLPAIIGTKLTIINNGASDDLFLIDQAAGVSLATVGEGTAVDATAIFDGVSFTWVVS